MGRGSRIARRALFALAVTLAFFVVVDVVLWIVGVPTLLTERDPFAGFSEQMRVYELDTARGVYRTPRRAVMHSFNYQQFKADKPYDGLRVFVLGGSSAHGFPWGGQVAFTRLLGEALRATWPERSVEAVNAAAMSYGSHRLRILAREVLDHRPDLLVIYGGHNEFVERRSYWDVLRRPEQLDRLKKLLYRWRLYSLMTRLYERMIEAREGGNSGNGSAQDVGALLGLDVTREYSENVGQNEAAEVIEEFEQNLRAILSLADNAGVKVILCTVPSNLRDWAPNQSFFTSEVAFDDQQQALALLAQARSALEAGDAAAAVTPLEQARELAPHYAEVHFRLGQAYDALGRYDDARASYVRARDTDGMPGRAVSAINATIRDLMASENALLLDAESLFEQASPHGLTGFNLIEDYVHPKPEGHRLIAYELWKMILERGLLGEARDADAELFRAALEDVETEPVSGSDVPAAAEEATTPDMLFNLAVVLENQGSVDEAVQKYRDCLRLEPRHAVARTNLGLLLNRQQRFSEAEQEFRTAIEQMPQRLGARIGLGESLRQQGRLDEAERVLTDAARVDGRSTQAWNRLGVVRSQLGQLAEAEAALRRAVELDPKDAEHQADLGYTLLFQGKLDEAREVFRTSVDLRPDRVRGRNGLAAVLVEQGRLDEAERLFRDSLRIDPGDSFARQGLAEIAKRRSGER
jgi:Flp pilus assembly protein TadD